MLFELLMIQMSSEATFELNNVQVAYDVNYRLENNNNGHATFLINFDDMRFQLEIIGNIAEKKSQGKLQFLSVGTARHNHPSIRIKSYPSNPQIELIIYQVCNAIK